jgi:hypothetical protein
LIQELKKAGDAEKCSEGRGEIVRKQGAQYNVSENLTVGLWISASLTLSGTKPQRDIIGDRGGSGMKPFRKLPSEIP